MIIHLKDFLIFYSFKRFFYLMLLELTVLESRDEIKVQFWLRGID